MAFLIYFLYISYILIAAVIIALVILIFMILIKTNKLLDLKIKDYIEEKKQ